MYSSISIPPGIMKIKLHSTETKMMAKKPEICKSRVGLHSTKKLGDSFELGKLSSNRVYSFELGNYHLESPGLGLFHPMFRV